MSSDIQDMQRQREIGWFGPKLKLHELRRQQRELERAIAALPKQRLKLLSKQEKLKQRIAVAVLALKQEA